MFETIPPTSREIGGSDYDGWWRTALVVSAMTLTLAACRPQAGKSVATEGSSISAGELPVESFAVFRPPLMRGSEEIATVLVRFRATEFEVVVIDNGDDRSRPRYRNL